MLGDEATVVPSAPLGPVAQPFVQPASSRRTGVMFDFPDRKEVVLQGPLARGVEARGDARGRRIWRSSVGGLSTAVRGRTGERALVYTRRIDLTKRTLDTAQQYEAVRSLFAEVEKTDAQSLLLAHR